MNITAISAEQNTLTIFFFSPTYIRIVQPLNGIVLTSVFENLLSQHIWFTQSPMATFSYTSMVYIWTNDGQNTGPVATTAIQVKVTSLTVLIDGRVRTYTRTYRHTCHKHTHIYTQTYPHIHVHHLYIINDSLVLSFSGGCFHLMQAQSTGVTMSEGQSAITVASNLAIISSSMVKRAYVILSQIQHPADENITVGTLPPPLTSNYVSRGIGKCGNS